MKNGVNGVNGVNTKKPVNGKIYVCNKYMQRYEKTELESQQQHQVLNLLHLLEAHSLTVAGYLMQRSDIFTYTFIYLHNIYKY